MAFDYQPQPWSDGPTGGTPITADRLMHIEQGLDAVADEVTALRAAIAAMTGITPPASGSGVGTGTTVPTVADGDVWASTGAVASPDPDLFVLGSAPGTADDPVRSAADPDLYSF